MAGHLLQGAHTQLVRHENRRPQLALEELQVGWRESVPKAATDAAEQSFEEGAIAGESTSDHHRAPSGTRGPMGKPSNFTSPRAHSKYLLLWSPSAMAQLMLVKPWA